MRGCGVLLFELLELLLQIIRLRCRLSGLGRLLGRGRQDTCNDKYGHPGDSFQVRETGHILLLPCGIRLPAVRPVFLAASPHAFAERTFNTNSSMALAKPSSSFVAVT